MGSFALETMWIDILTILLHLKFFIKLNKTICFQAPGSDAFKTQKRRQENKGI